MAHPTCWTMPNITPKILIVYEILSSKFTTFISGNWLKGEQARYHSHCTSWLGGAPLAWAGRLYETSCRFQIGFIQFMGRTLGVGKCSFSGRDTGKTHHSRSFNRWRSHTYSCCHYKFNWGCATHPVTT